MRGVEHDLTAGKMLTLAEVARAVVPGRRMDISTVFRWLHHGAGGVRLKATRIGRRWWVSADDLAAFVRELNSPPQPAPPVVAPPRKRGRPRRQPAAV